jgi:hypothetical protein
MVAMPPRPLASLKGRDLRALSAFRDRLRSALGKTLLSVAFLARRPIDVPALAAAPARIGRPEPGRGPAGKGPGGGGLALQAVPAPEPPGELRLLVRVERRDVWVEERVDAIALEVALETGALVVPYVYAPEELATPAARASRLLAELAEGEELP